MESAQVRAEPGTQPLRSPAGDVRRARTAGSASVQELRKWLQSHRGKSSQELLGDLGKSSLLGPMIKSTIGWVLLLMVLTVVPYCIYGKPDTVKASRNAKPMSGPAAAVADPSPTLTAPAAASGSAPEGVNVDQAKQVMGLDETKMAPDNVNPREKDLDNLLDGVK